MKVSPVSAFAAFFGFVGVTMSLAQEQPWVRDDRTKPAAASSRGVVSPRKVSDHVKVCQVGYRPGEAKFAVLTAAPSGDVIVRRASDAGAVMTVPAAAAKLDESSGDETRAID